MLYIFSIRFSYVVLALKYRHENPLKLSNVKVMIIQYYWYYYTVWKNVSNSNHWIISIGSHENDVCGARIFVRAINFLYRQNFRKKLENMICSWKKRSKNWTEEILIEHFLKFEKSLLLKKIFDYLLPLSKLKLKQPEVKHKSSTDAKFIKL